LENFVDRQLGQAVQLQFQDGVHLHRRQADYPAAGRTCFAFQRTDLVLAAVQLYARDLLRLAAFGDGHVLLGEIPEQVFLRFRAAGRTTDDPDYIVQVIQRDLVADQNVLALSRFAQFVQRAPAYHFDAMLDKQLEEGDQSQFARLPADDREQDHAERFLHLGVFEQAV